VNYLDTPKKKPSIYNEGFFTAVSIGFFFLLLGAIFLMTPNLFNAAIDFLQNLELVRVPHTDMFLPAPADMAMHSTVYQAVGQISIAVCAFQILMIGLRFAFPSSWNKRAETFGNFVYWAGAAFLVQTYLVNEIQWFVYWALLVIVIGVSLIARAAILAARRI
jgi:hypothetical protein